MDWYTLRAFYYKTIEITRQWERALAFFDEPPRYYTFLLTVWEERNQDPNSPGVWRFRLEDPRTGQRQGFANLEALMVALGQEMDETQGDRESD